MLPTHNAPFCQKSLAKEDLSSNQWFLDCAVENLLHQLLAVARFEGRGEKVGSLQLNMLEKPWVD